MLSLTAAMRGRAATVAFALCFCISNAFEFPRGFFLDLDTSDERLPKLISCSQKLGTTKCLTAFSVWRAQKAIKSINNNQTKFDLNADLQQFPWKRYANETDEQLYTDLCDGTESLLQYRRLSIDVNANYKLELGSSGNGTLKVDVIKNNDVDTGRGYMKKLKKKFYQIVPLLLVPGLIMSAILPFVLPALKMMTVAVGILNNMALSGAVFTLLRNNAFNEVNQHRIIYVNEGYHNERHREAHAPSASNDLHQYSKPSGEIIREVSPHNEENIFIGGNTEIKEVPVNAIFPWFENSDVNGHVTYADTKLRRSNGVIRNKNVKKTT